MNLKNIIYAFITITILIVLFFLFKESVVDRGFEGRFYYGEYNVLENKTSFFFKDIEEVTPQTFLFEIEGMPNEVFYNSPKKSFFYLAGDFERKLMKANVSGGGSVIEKGNILDDFLISEDGKYLAYQKITYVEPGIEQSEETGFEDVFTNQNILDIHVYNLETGEDKIILTTDPIQESILFINFSLDGKQLYFDRLKNGVEVAGEFNVFDLEKNSLLQTWQAPSELRIVSTPVLSPNQNEYVIMGGERIGFNQLKLLSLKTGQEKNLTNVVSEYSTNKLSEIFWSKDNENIFYSILSEEGSYGIWNVNKNSLEISQIALQGEILETLSNGPLIYKINQEGDKTEFYITDSEGKAHQLITEIEKGFYIGIE